MRFAGTADVLTRETGIRIRTLVRQAVRVERRGLRVETDPTDLEYPDDLLA